MRSRIVLLTVGWVLIVMLAKAVPYFSLQLGEKSQRGFSKSSREKKPVLLQLSAIVRTYCGPDSDSRWLSWRTL